MAKERRRFREIFQEDENEKLTLLLDVEVKGEPFKKGFTFTANDELAGVNFHKYRYLDLAVDVEEGGEAIKLVGFYPAK